MKSATSDSAAKGSFSSSLTALQQTFGGSESLGKPTGIQQALYGCGFGQIGGMAPFS